MSEDKSPFWRETSFKAGNQAATGKLERRGRDVGHLARRYTVDAVRALVEVVRLPAATHAAPKIAAARSLLEIGHPGIWKGAPGAAAGDAAQLHLLALQALAPPGTAGPQEPAPDDGEAEPVLDAESLIGGGDYSILPEPDEGMPEEALPLWDVWKARQRMMAARDAEVIEGNETRTQDSGDASPESTGESAHGTDTER
jgi:hypothetical protein